MASLSSIVERTRAHLTGAFRGELTLLGTTMTSVQTTVTLTAITSTISQSSIISIDQELFYVMSADPTGLILTVIRGHLGTTAAAHTAGAVIEVNPRFPGALIYMALLDEINGLPEMIYAVVGETYSVAQFTETILLNASPVNYADVYGLIDVRQSPASINGFNYPIGAYTSWPRLDYSRLERGADTGDFATGVYLRLGGRIGFGGSVRVTLAVKPSTMDQSGVTTATPATDTVTGLGLPRSFTDVLSLGTALRLYQPRDIDRTQRQGQGESRFAQEVPVGGITQTAIGLDRIYQRRLGQEVDKLRSAYPIRMSIR